ncbi:MAG: lipid A deacylase LpxR family protein [Taibaiella sp.]|nr:lipid A deacylase LpxR family protein [Taibaiella sp.]
MKRLYRILYLLPLVATLAANAQMIDNTVGFKNINSDKYFRLNYENDFFSATDIYYTQGINLEIVAPWARHFILSKALLHPRGWYTRYGIGIEHNGYTPTSIGHDEILHGDRPFGGTLALKTFQISIDTTRRQRLSTTLYTGILGAAAGTAEMQTGIHRWLHNIRPRGWPNQIHNDAVLDYEVDYEKQIFSLGRYLLLDVDARACIGTLRDNAGVGSTLYFGYYDSPYDIITSNARNFRIYGYEHAGFNAIGYDATLQGGLFNRSSPYTIPTADITRGTFENRFGFVVMYRRISLEYFQSFLSPEFSTGKMHVWGGIQIAFGL